MSESKNELKAEAWNYDNYKITSSLGLDDSIFINIVNSVTYQNYEDKIIPGPTLGGLPGHVFYTIMKKSFERKPSYDMKLHVEPSLLRITFSAIFDGFFPIKASIDIPEKLIAGNQLMTLKLTEMELNYQQEIAELKERINQLENEHIVFAYHTTEFGRTISFPRNIESIDFNIFADYELAGNFQDFNKLHGLVRITISDHRFEYVPGCRNILCTSIHSNHKNYTTKVFSDAISFNAEQVQRTFQLNVVENLFDSRYIFLPSVKELEINYGNGIIPVTLRSIPNVEKLSFIQYGNTAFTPFPLIKEFKLLKRIVFKNCLVITELDQIKNWCETKQIKLEIN